MSFLGTQVFGRAPLPQLNTDSQEAGEDPTGTVKAALDIGDEATNADTVIQATTAGLAGNSITLTFIHSGAAPAAGSLTRVGTAFTYTYLGATTTVADFEAAVDALAGADDLIEVKTPGTGAAVLADTVDEFSAVALAGGEAALRRLMPVGACRGQWSLHLLVTGTPTGSITFAYSNLPYPDLDDPDHWVVDASKTVTLSGSASRTFTTGVDKIAERCRVEVTLTAGSGSIAGWATIGA